MGLGGGHAAPLPWWMGDARHGTGAFAAASTAGLLSPAALRALLKALRAHAVLATVKAHFTERAADPAAARRRRRRDRGGHGRGSGGSGSTTWSGCSFRRLTAAMSRSSR